MYEGRGRDEEIMLAGCTSLLQVILGSVNWERWNKVREQYVGASLASEALSYHHQGIGGHHQGMPGQHEGTTGHHQGTAGHATQPDIHTFVHWLLDLAEEHLSEQGYSAFEENDSVVEEDAEASVVTNLDTTPSGGGCDMENGDDVKKMGFDDMYDDLARMGGDVAGQGPGEAGGHVVTMTPFFETTSKRQVTSYLCESCRIYLKHHRDIPHHMAKLHPASAYTMSCSVCLLSFSDILHYLAHHKDAHVGGRYKRVSAGGGGGAMATTDGLAPVVQQQGKLQCNYCQQLFSRPSALREHIANRHHNTLPRYECSACGSKFRYASGLSRHRGRCPNALLAIPAPPSHSGDMPMVTTSLG